ncbi:fimbria/pilus outer membrane usher protein, partial [Serratia marcescens]
GKAVVADVNSYYRNKASIDLNSLSDNVEATRSVVQATLTEGAIGYRKFEVMPARRRWRSSSWRTAASRRSAPRC